MQMDMKRRRLLAAAEADKMVSCRHLDMSQCHSGCDEAWIQHTCPSDVL